MKIRLSFLLLLSTIIFQVVLSISENDVIQTPCSTNETLINYNIYSGKIAQFFSPNYPKTLFAEDCQSGHKCIPLCQATFYTVIQNQRIWIALYNGYTTPFTFSDNINYQSTNLFDSNIEIVTFASQTQSATFKTDDYYIQADWAAFQGVVIAYDPSIVQCPFSGQSINFTNLENNLIVPIASEFDVKQADTFCQWTFSTSLGQYLKIVFKKLIVNDEAVLELHKNGELFQTFDKSIEDTVVYHFISDGATFTLYYNDTNYGYAGTSFSALISCTNLPISTITEPCNSTTNGNITKVFNLNYEVGYLPNHKCEYKIPTYDHTVIFVYVNIFHIEKNADTLFLNYAGNDYVLNVNDKTPYLLSSATNNSVITFTADSSLQQAGFEITLETMECPDLIYERVISCSWELEIYPFKQFFYCDGWKGTYHISKNQSCLEKNGFQFILQARDIRENLDYFNIYVNGELKEILNKAIKYIRYFTSDTNITVEFISGFYGIPIKSEGSSWSLTLKSAELPEPPVPFMLTKSSPMHIVELMNLDPYFVISVCSPENDTLELFISSETSQLQNYILYDGRDFENFVGKLDSYAIFHGSLYFGRMASTSNCFVIQKTETNMYDESGSFLFRMQNTQSQNCENSNNVIGLRNSNGTYIFSAAAANSRGNCEMIILSSDNYPLYFYSMNGTSTNDAVFTFKSITNQNILAKINLSEMSLWRNLKLLTTTLAILIPPSSTFSALASSSIRDIYVEVDGQKGFLASPSYIDSVDSHYLSHMFYIANINRGNFFTAEFVLRSIEGNVALNFRENAYDKNYTLTNPGDKLTLNVYQIYVSDYGTQTANDTFVIDYVFYLNKDVSSTTSSKTTTTISEDPTMSTRNISTTSQWMSPNISTTSSAFPIRTTTSGLPVPTTESFANANNFSKLSTFVTILFCVLFGFKLQI